MKQHSFSLKGRRCGIMYDKEPEILLLQPGDDSDLKGLEEEFELIGGTAQRSAALAYFRIDDWFSELSPWDAPPVFGKQAFGHGAGETLRFITEDFLPELSAKLGAKENIPRILGGYSLAGLFALWAGYETDAFYAVAAASPSVWFEGWTEYVSGRRFKARAAYLSLGDREEKTKNRTMARVGERIRAQYALFKTQIGENNCFLEWNEGGHFVEPARRTAKAFIWCLEL